MSPQEKAFVAAIVATVPFDGTFPQLYAKIGPRPSPGDYWPPNTRQLGRAIVRHHLDLQDVGVVVARRTNKPQAWITISRRP